MVQSNSATSVGETMGVLCLIWGCITGGCMGVGDGHIRGCSVQGRGFVNPPPIMVIWDLSGALAASEEPMPLRPVSHLTISIRLPIYAVYSFSSTTLFCYAPAPCLYLTACTYFYNPLLLTTANTPSSQPCS